MERKDREKSYKSVNVDFTGPMLEELDTIANEFNISRQAVIKTYLRHATLYRQI